MIYVTPNPESVPPDTSHSSVVLVGPKFEFSRKTADRWLDLHRLADVWFVTPERQRWFHLPQIGRLCDYFLFRGSPVRHIDVPSTRDPDRVYSYDHDLYYSARLEKLYSDDILNEWRQPRKD